MRAKLRFKSIALSAILLSTIGSAFGQGETPPPKPQAKLVGKPEVIVDRLTGQGSIVIHLRNPGTSALPVSLAGTATGARPKVTFRRDQSTDKSEAIYNFSIEPDKVANVQAIVTDAKEAGEFEIDLTNGDESLGKMKVMHLPFAVTLAGPSPDKAELAMVKGSPTTLTLKNDDPVAYSLLWRLSINGKEVCGDKLTLQAKGLGLLQCQPSVSFSPAKVPDLFKVESTEGHSLLLYPETTPGNFDKTAPWKIIPVKASLSYFGPSTQQFWGYLAILVVLIAGGLTSLTLSQALPNRLKRLNIKERLENTAKTTANLRSSIGSRLQVLLRLERGRLYDLLNSRNTFSPDFAGIFTRCSEDTAKLESRVALVQQMDVILERLEQKLTLGPPPSRISKIEALIEDARVLLQKTQPTDKDLEAAQTAITEAAKRVDNLNQADEEFGKVLATRVLEVKADIDANFANKALFTRLKNVLPGPYDALQRVPAGTNVIAPDQYTSLDMAVEKMFLLKDYMLLFEGTADQAMLDRLKLRETKLLNLLQLQSWPAVRSARLLLREMKEDVYPERVQETLLAPGATIVMEPSVAYDKAPLEFCVCFSNPAIDEATAREEWTCLWAFGDNLNERGWNASHYFLLQKTGRFKSSEPAEFTVRATFRDRDGNVLLNPATNEPFTLEKPVRVRPRRREGILGDRSRTELLKLMAALLIAVFALVSGAREQLLKLDILPGLIAVFLVGFGADTIKNLLTKSESTT